MENKVKILIVFPIILIIILILIANSIHFKGELSKTEMQTLSFTPSDVMVKQRPRIQISEDLKSPVDFNPVSSVQGAFPPVPLGTLAPQADYPGKTGLSLIVISGKNRMAIIRGIVVKEGDRIDGIRIAKIEPDRVLLKNNTDEWLHMEKIK